MDYCDIEKRIIVRHRNTITANIMFSLQTFIIVHSLIGAILQVKWGGVAESEMFSHGMGG